MGAYTDRLHQRARAKKAKLSMPRLIGCAIIRDGQTHKIIRGSHSQIRQRLGDQDIYSSVAGDREGFFDSEDNFLSRENAADIGGITGQVPGKFQGRRLLSSDISW